MAHVLQRSVSGYARRGYVPDAQLQRDDTYQAALDSAKRFARRPEEVLRAISTAERLDARLASRPDLRHLHALFYSVRKSVAVREAFLQLLLHTHRVCDFHNTEPATPRYGGTFATGLLAVAHRYNRWNAPLADWKPTSHNSRRQFRELLQHLFCEYPVPAFLETAWFRSDGHGKTQQDWFIYVGRGNNPRTLWLPLTLTKRMAHIAGTSVPQNCSVEEGFRWAQIVGMGGSERLARAVIGSRLADKFHDEPFWETVLRFFVDNPLLDPVQVGPLIDYLWHERYSPRQAGDTHRLPPDFQMKGCTVAALLARMEAWHKTGMLAPRGVAESWVSCGINGFTHTTESDNRKTHWTIAELVTAKALIAEGRTMEHCVGTYAQSCARGVMSVWSLQAKGAHLVDPVRVITVAVRNRVIVEARGKRNALPGRCAADFGMRVGSNDAELLLRGRRVVQQWAKREGLAVPHYLAGDI